MVQMPNNASNQVAMGRKDKVRSLILSIYENYGITTALQKAQQLLKQCEDPTFDKDKRITIKGELAEVVLEIFCAHLQRSIANSIVSKGLCFYRKGDRRATTELDLVFFTPYCTYMFECKSYSGKKTLEGKCTLKGRFAKDVYGQNRYHIDMLYPYISNCLVPMENYPPDNPPFQLILFEMSSGDIIDNRTPEYQRLYPCLTLDTLLAWVQTEFARPRVILYDMAPLEKIIAELDAHSAEIFQVHLQRLQGRKQ